MTASIREAKAKLSELLDSAERGEEVIITSNGKPRVKLVPVRNRAGESSTRTKFGGWPRKHDRQITGLAFHPNNQ